MIRLRSTALAAALWAAACSATHAEHSGRPAKLPPVIPNTLFLYLDEHGAPFASESGAGSTATVLNIFGWGFDPQNPNSPFEASSPAFTSADRQFGYDLRTQVYAYNGSVLTLSNVNKHTLEDLNSNLKVGPNFLVLHDESQLTMTNSVIGNLQLYDESNASLTNTQFIDLADGVEMNSSGQLTLTGVSTLPQVGSDGFLPSVIATKGTTLLDSSTVDEVVGRGDATITIRNSTVRSNVRTESDEEATATVKIEQNSVVGKITASRGAISMEGGRVKGLVQANITGSLSIKNATVDGSVTCLGNTTGNSSIFLDEATIEGNLVALSIDSTVVTTTSRVTAAGGVLKGTAFASGHGAVGILGVESVGTGAGMAAEVKDNASLSIREVSTIKGGVAASGNSELILDGIDTINGSLAVSSGGALQVTNLDRVAGDLTVSGKAKLALANIAVTGGAVVTENGSLDLIGGNSLYAFVQDGTLNLTNTQVEQSIAAHGKSHLKFAGSSRTGGTLFNLGTEQGLVSVSGGEVAGNLAGFGSSITAMSGGHVVGFPVFQGAATFLYSGGTFGLFGVPPAAADVSVGLENDAEAAPQGNLEELAPLPGFAAMGDAEIQFIGHDLQSTLVDPNFIYGESSYSVHQLTGRLADGTPVDGGLVYTENLFNARFSLIEAPVPEPTSLTLALVALLASARRNWGRIGFVNAR
ncbi:hypothetical protein [Lacipirellula limnantheis]|uniref:Autotransporter-associated beta strand repeat protein n=1 Tax=Lacipirellula limnantheis TaxID=2528024 RepID=A0A517TXW6_9BACT|nr:hypothetical protein [Lacipirellula limnantheis]QDT73199.1 hypothetical protein I41_23880 [Lacipirellula limnantheis]